MKRQATSLGTTEMKIEPFKIYFFLLITLAIKKKIHQVELEKNRGKEIIEEMVQQNFLELKEIKLTE